MYAHLCMSFIFSCRRSQSRPRCRAAQSEPGQSMRFPYGRPYPLLRFPTVPCRDLLLRLSKQVFLSASALRPVWALLSARNPRFRVSYFHQASVSHCPVSEYCFPVSVSCRRASAYCFRASVLFLQASERARLRTAQGHPVKAPVSDHRLSVSESAAVWASVSAPPWAQAFV